MWLYITSICVLLITVILVMNSSEYFVAPMGGNIFNDEILREFVRNKKSQREKYSHGIEYPQQPMYYENAPKSDGMYDLEDVSRMGLGGFLHADDEGSVDHNNNF